MYERIMEELKRMGFKSVRELERQADVSYGTVRNIKYGHMPPSDKLYRIADILGVSVNYLLTGKKDWDPLGDEPDPTPPEVYRKRRMVRIPYAPPKSRKVPYIGTFFMFLRPK